MKLKLLFIILLIQNSAFAQIRLLDASAWFETAYVKWEPLHNAQKYNVYYVSQETSPTAIDDPLIRTYGNYYRADAIGLKPGTYQLKVVPVINGLEQHDLSVTSQYLTVGAFTREGFAFVHNQERYIPGAYTADGTPKTGAKIIYVSTHNVNTVTCDIINERNIAVKNTGLLNIISAKGKGYDKTPLIIRVVGTIKDTDFSSMKNYFSFIGANSTTRLIENITIEGVGDDATIYGFGLFTKRSRGIEIRNLGIMLFGDDAISMEADNFNIWVHHCDFFYGKPGSDSDQVKGDGSIDMKYNTTNITISYNHFWDSGKSTFAGGAEESNPIFFTYHHNWFDHSDSRHARTCHSTVHMYNNYFDANATMCVLNTETSNVFIEANDFRNCPYPMMINMQGTNFEKWPTGSQDGGMTKAFNNRIDKVTKLLYQTDRPNDFDAYLVTERNETIPQTVKSRKGGNTYSNFDTATSMYPYMPDAPENVRAKVTQNAGRIDGGDFKWTFNNEVDDRLTVINQALKNAISNYQSQLIGVQGINLLPTNTIKHAAIEFNIYPNPFTNIVHIDIDATIKAINIYNMNGQLIEKVSNPSKLVNLSKITKGVYIIEIITQYNKSKQQIIKI